MARSYCKKRFVKRLFNVRLESSVNGLLENSKQCCQNVSNVGLKRDVLT